MRIEDVMTRDLVTVPESASLCAVAKEMRERNIGDVLVVDAGGCLRGIVTDRDIVVRAVAAGMNVTDAVGKACSKELTTLAPTDSLDHAVKVMQGKAIRRIPIVEDGKPVGIVSIGDLAQTRDPKSALGRISAAPPNC